MVTHNLPHYPTSFVGRESEVEKLHRLLDQPDCRLITIVGPGGMGKTRLAVETVKRYLMSESGRVNAFVNGIFFVPFQPISSSDHMVSTIADAIGFQFYQEHDLQKQLLNYLREKSMLLIMDNLEHLTKGLKLLSDILSTAPHVAIFATSRERLNLQEEWILDLGGLTFPTDEKLFNIEPYSAIKLFILHARRVHEGFSINEARQHVIVRICQLVEGMPLAIELAAVWVRVLSVEKIAAEIADSLDILTSSSRNVIPRHQNIRAALEPTWNRLTEIEQSVFRKLSIFRGGFTRQAAESVAGASLHTLSTLVDKSLVHADLSGRFDMHELLRQYAEEQLVKDGAESQQARDAHATFFTDFMKSREHDLNSGRQHEITREMEIELDNIRSAWRWAANQANVTALREGAHAYYMFCDIRGYYREAKDALDAAHHCLELLPSTEECDYALAVVSNARGGALLRCGQFEKAYTVLENSIRIYKRLGKRAPPGISTEPLACMGLLAATMGNYDKAVEYGKAALKQIDAQQDKLNLTYTHYTLASAMYSLGQYDSAFEHARKAYQISSVLGDRWFAAYILVVMGNIALANEDYDQAWAYYQTSYDDKKVFDDWGGMGFALNSLGRIAWLREDYRDAEHLFRQAHDLYVEVNDPGGLATSIFGLGDTAQAKGNHVTAYRLFRQALEKAVEIGWSPLILQIFVGISDLLQKTNELERAVELLSVVVQHPASEPPTQRRAEPLLEQLRNALYPKDFQSAQQRSTRLNIEKLARLMIERLQRQQTSPPHPANQGLIEPLTQREDQVLRLMADGLTNPQIAEKLIIATGTVKTYTNRIFSKLGVTNRVEAVNRASDLHLI